MRFRSSILVTLTAAAIAIGWVATTADADAPAPAARPAAAPTTSPPPPSVDCNGRIEMRSCLVELRRDLTPDPTWDRAHALKHKVDDDLPLAGNDDTPPSPARVRHGGIWE
jgi:hypothetical protein